MLEQIVEPLLAWFHENARILPWREKPEPYRVWVSEIMLQQTRVEAVKPFFERFTLALPDIRSLAECPTDQLLKLWEGLGYYNRVRNMQKAAQTIMEVYEGEMPADYEKLLSLQGIGPYTAGAVASIAFHIPVPAVDGNVLRVISRITKEEGDILKQSVKRKVERELMEIMPGDQAGAFNQALMELGATVCVPNGMPQCRKCPVSQICLAHGDGSELDFPKKSPKKSRKTEDRTVLVISDGTRGAICRRPDKGLLAGMYELPNFPGHLTDTEVLDWIKRQGLSAIRIQKLPQAKHIFSHIEWHMIGYAVLVEELDKFISKDMLFAKPRQTEKEFPIPAAFAAYTDYLQIKIGQERYENAEIQEFSEKEPQQVRDGR